mmetsp:Transcript_18479/g.28046  ORF Transcript_18479/g.28046 Transcript_18479/m.28046 type:complete len:329 (-) Transcript_18479:211-1197(-)
MSEETSISDLLPLVAAALNDKAAADAAKELAAAREERDIPRKVEVIRSLNNGGDEDEDEDVVVYSSGMFEDGQYARNTNLWDVTLEQNSSNICSLANLRDCHICVGGGFPVASLDHTLPNNATFEGWINGEDRRQGISGDACEVSFCFCPHTIWLVILIHGWPREAWEAVIQEDDYDQDDQHVVHFLVENVAEQYPDATVEFIAVTFAIRSIHGALKRLLPPKRKEQVRADREKRKIAREDWQGVLQFVESNMRERGIFDLFHWMAIVLVMIGIKKRSEFFDKVIEALIARCERSGMLTMEEANKIMSTMEEQQCSEDLGSDDEKSPK